MSKKKKTTSPVSPQQAAEFLAKGKYKEATDIYKKLLKTEPRPEWKTGLAKAYLLRAKNLAEKGMYKEASIIWENRDNLCDDKAEFEKYINWLIKANSYSKAVKLLMNSDLSKDNLQKLMVQFGALFFQGQTDIITAFPDDTPIVKHYKLIEQALTAYYQDDKQACETYLNQIPFRSPYQDFCLLFKVLLDFNHDSATKLLAKIPNDSPYANFAKLIKLAIEPYSIDLLNKLAKLSLAEKHFIAKLKGWNIDKFQTIIILSKIANKNISNKMLLETIINNHKVFGTDYAQRFCLAILPSYTRGIKLYEKTFTTLSEFEKNRILALYHELQQDDLSSVETYWQRCVNNLKSDRKKNSIKIALILRYLAKTLNLYGEPTDIEQAAEYVIQSIDYDPNNKNSYISLLKWYKLKNESKNYNKWVETAIKQLPQDSDILFIAMEAATNRKSFKKALKYATTLLKIDPINVKARNIARNSHIAHTHKLIKSGKYLLAHKELEAATKFEKNTKQTGIIQINQALLELQEQGFIKPIKGQQSKELRTKPLKPMAVKKFKTTINQYSKPIKLLAEGLQLAGDGIVSKFQLMIISKQQCLDSADIYPLAVENKFTANKRLPTANEITELVKLINSHAETGINFLTDIAEQMKSQLLMFTKVKLSKDDTLSLCNCIKKINSYELLEKFATNALKQWKQHPTLIFYKIYGNTKGDVWYLSDQQLDKLELAINNAKQQGDKRTEIMIAKFIEPMYEDMFPKFIPPNGKNNLLDEEELEAKLDQIDGEAKNKLEQLGIDMETMEQEGEIGPKQLFEVLSRLEELGIDLPIEIPRKK